MVKAQFGGIVAEGVEVDVLSEHEPWTEYQLSDGSVVRIKLIVSEVVRAKDLKSPTGEPLYSINFKTVVYIKAVGEGTQ